MSDVKEVKGIEQQQGQGSYNPNLYADNNLGTRLEPQAWQARANADAQKFVPSFDLQQSDTRTGADKYAAQQNPAMVQDSTRAGANKPQADGQRLDRDRPVTPGKEQGAAGKHGAYDKNGTDLPSKLNEKAGESAGKSAEAQNSNQHIEKSPADAKEGEEHIEKSPAGAKEGEEHIEKSPADAANPDGSQHMEKSEADATEDNSAGSYQGDSSERCDADNPRGQRTGLEQERERARTAYEAVTGNSAPRVFNSIGEGLSEARNTASNR
jgi:hypothetical protein